MATLTAEARRGRLDVIIPVRPNAPEDLRSREDQTLTKESEALALRSAGYRARGLLSAKTLKITEYQSVPPKRSFTINVRYEMRGRGSSLPYPLDNEE